MLTLFLFVSGIDLSFAAESPYKQYPAKQSSRDVKVPNRLVKTIETDYRTFMKTMKMPEGTAITRELLNVYVDLTQARAAALQENVRILTPVGGGVIDLQEFVTPLKGAFRARIVFERPRGEALKNIRVYYISRGERRNLDGDTFGAGCGRYFDITEYFNKKLTRDGVELFTADQRYVSVLAGTIVLVSFEREALHVGSVTFEDARYPALQCDS
jgi:hypothetical protein